MSVLHPAPVGSLGHGRGQVSTNDSKQAPAGTLLQRSRQAIAGVQSKIAPVWPLKDYVAVNPYLGYMDRSFLQARQSLQAVSDFETLMPVDYYRDQYRRGEIRKSDIDVAVDELVSDGVTGAERIDINQVFGLLLAEPLDDAADEFNPPESSAEVRRIRTISETLDSWQGSDWFGVIRDEMTKHCASHYDQGQSLWSSPWRQYSLYQAWRSAARYDRTFECLGVDGFRSFVGALPHDPDAAVAVLLENLGVPEELWEDVLQCHAMATIGWSSWTHYKQRQAESTGEEDTDFAGLLAIRLTYEVALAKHHDFHLDWNSVLRCRRSMQEMEGSDEVLLRYALLKASEIAYRRKLLGGLTAGDNGSAVDTSGRALAQMVFCIDVRSERIRRHLEAACDRIETYGFAGFFGLPIAYVPLGESEAIDQVPVLLSPQFHVHERIDSTEDGTNERALAKRSRLRSLRKSWKEFQSSAVSCFGFVESAGLLYGLKLVARSLKIGAVDGSRFDGVAKEDRKHLGPCLAGLESQGVDLAKQAEMAEAVLRGIGIVENFSRLVVLCGHGSQTENNPLQAGLDCGACGGHSGEANARFAAKLLNQSAVRAALAQRGIAIPHDTRFVAALHNTTTDEVKFFDVNLVPESHRAELQELSQHAQIASRSTRSERLGSLPGDGESDLIQRSQDWSEVRPEWGLAGNAAFIAAPRSLTEPISLAGRSFLHSYDYRRDPEFKVLEQIMTAPMVVAHWINMQYYASTVDPQHFGSGNKAIHNVVGRFGILSGNGGDLTTGLPWQSIHDGEQFQHHPLRLLVILAAPREAIDQIIQKHDSVRDMLAGGWLQLVALEDGNYYRLSQQQQWDRLADSFSEDLNEPSNDNLVPSL